MWILTIISIMTVIFSHVEGEIQSITQANDPLQLEEYESYGDIQMFTFQIPSAAVQAVFQLEILRNNSANCENERPMVHIQHGSFPIVSPNGEAFPDHFYLNRTSARSIVFDYHIHTTFLIVHSPLPGTWFIGAYLKHSGDESLTPDIFSKKKCKVYLKPTNTVLSTLNEIITFNIQREQSVTVEDYLYIRFFIPDHAYEYEFRILDCTVLFGSDCYFEMQLEEHRWPSNATHSVACNYTSGPELCLIKLIAPQTGVWHYARIGTGNATLVITASIHVEECSVAATNATQASCLAETMNRNQSPSKAFAVTYYRTNKESIAINDKTPYVTSVNVRSLEDSGGTLMYKAISTNVNDSVQATIYSCIKLNRIIQNPEEIKNCSLELDLPVAWERKSSSALYVPYPEAGVWHVSVIAECFIMVNDIKSIIPCTESPHIFINATIRQCVDDHCNGKYGTCYGYYSGTTRWSVCKCKVGYRGYGCTDATNAIPDSIQLLDTLLLTLSNLMIFAASIVALHRKWFPEALVYFFASVASSFYHACDNGTIYAICPVTYGMLQYCDFFGSLTCFWVTIMALSKIPPELRAFFHIAGILGILVGTQYTLTGTWNFIAITSAGLIILGISWIRMCKKTKKVYPSARIWLTGILPGGVCLVLGLVIYAAVETESNYPYTHSAWHCIIALAVIFCLPRYSVLDCSKCSKGLGKYAFWSTVSPNEAERVSNTESSLLPVEEESNGSLPV